MKTPSSIRIDKWAMVGIASLLIIMFLLAARWYKNREAERTDSLISANVERLVRSYSPTLGPDSAPVTIVEFLDPECEACSALYPMVKQVMDEFSGKVRLVVRYMPFHKNSAYAAAILESARKQHKYWEALEVLFVKQKEWGSHHDPKPELLLGYMRTLGLDMDRLDSSMKDMEIQSKIRQDEADGRHLGVSRTPAFFINGEMLQELGYQEFRSAIKRNLK